MEIFQLAVATLILVYITGCVFSPFICWPSFAATTSSILLSPTVRKADRAKLLWFVVKELLFCPLRTFLWYLDELLYPSYKRRRLDSPVFIVSQPRSGTTFLLRTLSEDSDRFLSLKHFEWRYPFISIWKALEALNLRTWIEEISYWPKTPTGEVARKIHYHVLGSHEEHGIFFEEIMFHHYFVFRRFPFPDLLPRVTNIDHLSDARKQRMVDVFVKVVQKAHWHRGGNQIWLTKENESVDLYRLIASRFDDARFLVIVRPPREMLNSYVTMSITCTAAKHEMDPRAIPGWHEANIEFRRRQCAKFIEFCQEIAENHNCAFITFDQFTTRIKETTEFIYQCLAIPLNRAFLSHLEELQRAQDARKPGYQNPDLGIVGFEFYEEFVDSIAKGHWPGKATIRAEVGE